MNNFKHLSGLWKNGPQVQKGSIPVLGCIQTAKVCWSGLSLPNLVPIQFWTLCLVCIQAPVNRSFLHQTKACEQSHVTKDRFSHWLEIMREGQSNNESPTFCNPCWDSSLVKAYFWTSVSRSSTTLFIATLVWRRHTTRRLLRRRWRRYADKCSQHIECPEKSEKQCAPR